MRSISIIPYQPPSELIIKVLNCLSILFIALIFALIPACVERKMTLKEAKQVTIRLDGKSFVPPPRRVDDILNVLDQKGQFDPEIIAKMKEGADVLPPDTRVSSKLTRFYFKRGLKARDLGRYKQYLEDHRKALGHNEKARARGRKGLNDRDYAQLLVELAIAEANFGNYGRGIELLKQSISINAWNSAIKYRLLATCYLLAGDLKAGEETTKIGIDVCNEQSSKPGLNEFRTDIYKREKALLQSELLDAKGKFAEAEPHRRVAVKILDKQLKEQNRKAYFYYKCSLAMNLAHQGRLLEA
ncbi:MAG: hypothetical protein JRJ85_24695 [Deltaproteobacteria bacterium]|nr:hypothetical protein [Deltaproteobacteria bacterium]